MKTPLSIITGYLGAGKTTLLKKIVEQTDKKIAILMNEFGEISIDSKIIKGKNIDMKELLGGCVCCSLTGEFDQAINEIIERINPELIVVETTGVAEPDALALDIEENIKSVKLDSIITVVDADSIVKYPHIGHTGRVQIEIADILILSKKDLITKEQLKQVKKLIRALNQKAVIIATSKSDINTKILFGLTIERSIKERHKNHKTTSIEYFSYKSNSTIDKKKFEEFANSLNKKIYRSKGFVKLEDGLYLFQYVSGRWDLEKFEEERKTELIFIGKKIKQLEKDAIDKLKKCEIK